MLSVGRVFLLIVICWSFNY